MTDGRRGAENASAGYLAARLAVLEERVRAAVTARRATDPRPDDPFRGLYLADEDIDRLLADGPCQPVPAPRAEDLRRRVEAAADAAEASGVRVRLRELRTHFGIDDDDVELLLVALAPDVDGRFARLYGYLHDDVSQRRATVALGLALTGRSTLVAAARQRFLPTAPLVAGGLLVVGDEDRPLPSRSLLVPERVVAHLLGGDDLDPVVAAVRRPATLDAIEPPTGLAAALTTGSPCLAYVRASRGAGGVNAAVAAVVAASRTPIVVDLDLLPAALDPAEAAAAAAREARLAGGVLVAAPVEALAERSAGAVRAFADAPGDVVLVGRGTWDPMWSQRVALTVDAPARRGSEAVAVWRAHVDAGIPDDALDALAAGYVLDPDQVVRAVAAARTTARATGEPAGVDHLRAGARAQNAVVLEQLARRLEPVATWDDLVLPPPTLDELRHLVARVRHEPRVVDEWRLRGPGGRRRGVAALFAGESGTGKTLAAEVIAGELGLDLYVIDLARVVDKYVGETEKNLGRIFAAAESVNGLLLFDEADSLFGKRSEVRDAHDRYANIEVSYLLQRMEAFDGFVLLATNLRANLDEAFTRRLDAVVDFPMPDVAERLQLWRGALGDRVPQAGDADLEFCARSFRLAGGHIRAVALTAGHFAAVEDRPVTMVDLVRATEREYRKLGRLCTEAEFGPYLAATSARSGNGSAR